MSPPRSLGRSVADGLVCWASVVASAFVVTALLGVWSPADLTTRGVASELPWFGVVALSSLLVVALPVALYLHRRLVAPLAVAGAYAAYFAWFGVATGAPSAPLVTLMYSWVAAPAVVLATLVEVGWRRRPRGARRLESP